MQSTNVSLTLKCKLVGSDQLRRRTIPLVDGSIQTIALRATIAELFDLNEGAFKMYYRDDDDDLVTLDSDEDVQEALMIVQLASPKPILRLEVRPEAFVQHLARGSPRSPILEQTEQAESVTTEAAAVKEESSDNESFVMVPEDAEEDAIRAEEDAEEVAEQEEFNLVDPPAEVAVVEVEPFNNESAFFMVAPSQLSPELREAILASFTAEYVNDVEGGVGDYLTEADLSSLGHHGEWIVEHYYERRVRKARDAAGVEAAVAEIALLNSEMQEPGWIVPSGLEVPPEMRAAILDALTREYVEDIDGAVGAYFDTVETELEETLGRGADSMIERHIEKRVRQALEQGGADAAAAEIGAIAGEDWSLTLPPRRSDSDSYSNSSDSSGSDSESDDEDADVEVAEVAEVVETEHTWEGIWCDGCEMKPLFGSRFMKQLPNDTHDLCNACFGKLAEAEQQQFNLVDPPAVTAELVAQVPEVEQPMDEAAAPASMEAAFSIGDEAIYTPTGEPVKVLGVHFDDAPHTYFTIQMPQGSERQTPADRLIKTTESADCASEDATMQAFLDCTDLSASCIADIEHGFEQEHAGEAEAARAEDETEAARAAEAEDARAEAVAAEVQAIQSVAEAARVEAETEAARVKAEAEAVEAEAARVAEAEAAEAEAEAEAARVAVEAARVAAETEAARAKAVEAEAARVKAEAEAAEAEAEAARVAAEAEAEAACVAVEAEAAEAEAARVKAEAEAAEAVEAEAARVAVEAEAAEASAVPLEWQSSIQALRDMGFSSAVAGDSVLKAQGDLEAALEAALNYVPPAPPAAALVSIKPEPVWEEAWNHVLSELEEMGFDDVESNKRFVVASAGDLKATVTALVADERSRR